ncbi:CRISPR-associated protein, TM1812 family [Thermodesulfobium narugense DSM 14796]|uniref:CRISPR-associated protein, TM1812 family n=1 Tax=Thermodesulfobium narugense DSM 14796 TaxID=747365 RepID=M1E602_9BACT|nr:TIGR02221 family CRISPR-associated protein [Thermodesulfobium narugense]AEE15342.1 CRISPR-associated protein, TM1812 family [Thermodesulfobium narugense DSM 14796]
MGKSVLLSFLGTGDYEPVKYFINDEEKFYLTKYAPIAVAKLNNIEKIILFLTKEAKEKHFEKFKEEIKNNIELEEKSIPEGRTEQERWEIWDRVIDSAEGYDLISFDITHSYRLIPFYVFLTIEFLRNIKGVELDGLYYCLYDKEKEKNPIINLNEVLGILSWINFSGFFVRTGIFTKDAKEFIRSIHAKAYKNNNPIKPKFLQTIAGNFESISSALNLSQEIKIDIYISDLIKNLRQESILLKEANYLSKPFVKIFERVKSEYEGLVLEDQNKPFFWARRAINKAKWCLEHGLLIQSVLLLRESLINAFIKDKEELTDREKREKIYSGCNYMSKTISGKSNAFFEAVDKVNNLRNLIAHCGYNRNLLDEKSIENNIKNLIELIENAITEDNIKEVRDFLDNKNFIEIDLGQLYNDVAKIDKIEEYKNKALEIAGNGKDVVLTGNAPVWLYLYVAHALHGKAKSLRYSSPVLKDFIIFDHNPY